MFMELFKLLGGVRMQWFYYGSAIDTIMNYKDLLVNEYVN